jgi:hypothetical protein
MPNDKCAAEKVEQVEIGRLRPSEYNPRRMDDEQMEQLMESIRRHGFVEPIVANSGFKGRDGVVIGGHQRLEAAKRLGLDTVPVVWVSLPPKQEKELNLRLNRNTGRWDAKKLVEMGQEVLLDAGFNESDIIAFESQAGTLEDVEIESSKTRVPLMLSFRTRKEYDLALAHYVGEDAVERTKALIGWWKDGKV